MVEIKDVLNTTMLWDTNELIKQLPDKSIDLIVTDPPYALQWGWSQFKDKRKYLKEITDQQQFAWWFSNELLYEFKRVLKLFNWYFFCNKHQVKQYLDFAYENDYTFDILTWHKTNPSPLCNGVYLPDTEYIIFIKEKGVKVGGSYHTKSKYWVTKVQKNKYDHPTLKPWFLMERMLINSSNEGDIILDPFMGSGSTAVECLRLHRNFIGFEMEQKYIDITNKRLSEELWKQ